MSILGTAPVEEQVEDWSKFEVAEQPALDPEKDADRLVAADADTKEKEIQVYRDKVNALIPTDDRSVTSCGLFVEQCKLAAKRVEGERENLVGPLNAQVKKLNAERIPVRDAFLAMAKAVTERVNKFIEDRRLAAELEQKRINDEIAAKQAELDRKAEEARQEAERIRQEQERQAREAAEQVRLNEARRVELERQRLADIRAAEQAIRDGNEKAAREAEARAQAAKEAEEELARKAEAERLEAEAEQARLAKEAEKKEAKADTLEMKASELVPSMVSEVSKKVELEDSTVSFAGGGKEIWSLPGWDKKEKLRVVFNGEADRRIAKLIGDLDKLPPGVQFILGHCALDPVFLNKSFGSVKFPEPFAKTKDYSRSSVRG